VDLTKSARIYGQTITAISRAEGLSGKGAMVQRGARFISFGVRLQDPRQIDKALKLAEPLAAATNRSVVIARRERGLILYQFQLDGKLWEKYTRADLQTDIGVGLAEGMRQIDYSFKPTHTIVAGTTGSGKTETVRSMLAALFEYYTPDKLQAVILDLKGKFSEFANVSHLYGLDIARSNEEINRALIFVNNQIEQREQNSDFNARRMVIVIDEAEAIFNTEARLAIGEALVKRGREVRIHGLFASQEPHTGKFGKRMFKQVTNRWVGWVDQPLVSYHITGRAGVGCNELTSEGDFVHLGAGKEIDRLQVAMVTQADFDRLPRGNNGDPPEIDEDADILDVAQLPEPEPERGPGRPPTSVDPRIVGYYDAMGPDEVSGSKANKVFGLGHTLHVRHREFTKQMAQARKAVQEQWMKER